MLDPTLKALAQGKNFATFTTMMANGYPQTSIMWIDADDEFLLINTELHRAKYANAVRDSHVNVVIWDGDNPYRYVEARGDVVGFVTGEEARRHIDTVSNKYVGTNYSATIESERVIVKIAPQRVRLNG
jgi:PPOX class probable F420-dependent enzyme